MDAFLFAFELFAESILLLRCLRIHVYVYVILFLVSDVLARFLQQEDPGHFLYVLTLSQRDSTRNSFTR